MTTFYQNIELTEEEIQEALLERKKRKFFHLKHRDYWQALEGKESKTKVEVYGKYSDPKLQSHPTNQEPKMMDKPF
jgi:hypothetical protein